ncbi:MAG: DUF3048 domain-containing protein [Nocardioidaceae bacterium]
MPSPLQTAARPARIRRRLLAALGLPMALSLTLAACGGGDDQSTSGRTPGPSDTTGTAAGTTTVSGQWPLTGEKLTGDAPKHPVYAVKIDNTASSQPQVGLRHADMVVEELVEGGATRLAAFYYSDVPHEVGPVRSMRSSDIDVVKPTNAYLVTSGGARPTLRRVSAAHIKALTGGAPGYHRVSSRPAPYNLFIHLNKLAAKPGKGWKPPPHPYLPFGGDDLSGGRTVHSLAATFSSGHTTEWKHRASGWVRTNSYAGKGDDFTADNVLVLRVKEGDAGYKDPAGNPVPETELTGKGQALLVHGTTAVKAVWHKRAKGAPIRLHTTDGKALKVPSGHTFIELVPRGTGSVTTGK